MNAPRLAWASVLAAVLIASHTSSQTPTFPAATDLVTVDAVVEDRAGQPVLGLSAADFTIKEDGVPREIVAFEAVQRPLALPAGGEPPAQGPPRTSSNLDAAARIVRSFVLVFDERHLDSSEAESGRKALLRFLERDTGAGDGVTLVGTQTGVAWTSRLPEGRDALVQVLKRLQGRRVGEVTRDAMSDYEAMRIDRDSDPIVTDRVARRFVATGELHREVTLRGESPSPPDLEAERSLVRVRASQVYGKAAADNDATLVVIERSLLGLGAVRGRKSLVLVSAGFVHDSRLSGFQRVLIAARRANVALYFLDARGLSAAPSALRADVEVPSDVNDLSATLDEARNASEGSESLAADTGGFSVRNDNDLLGGLERIGREAANYYLLGFKPVETRADGRFHKIEVKLAQAGARVRARRGYYAPDASGKSLEAEGRDAAIQRALDSPFELADVPLRATSHVFGEKAPGKASVLLTAEADIHGVAFQVAGNAAKDTLELMLVVTNRDTAEFHRFDQQFELSLRPETRASYERTWFPIERQLDLAPGSYQAKIIVRDHNDGRLGSLTHDFQVPAASGLRLSTPMLSDRLQDSGAEAHLPAPTARRSFPASGVLHCRFEVYGAAKDAKTGQPNVTAGFSIRRSDGRFLAAMPETLLAPGPGGSLSRSFGTALDGAPPGRYEMIVVVTDVAGGRATEAREPFVVAAPKTP